MPLYGSEYVIPGEPFRSSRSRSRQCPVVRSIIRRRSDVYLLDLLIHSLPRESWGGLDRETVTTIAISIARVHKGKKKRGGAHVVIGDRLRGIHYYVVMPTNET